MGDATTFKEELSTETLSKLQERIRQYETEKVQALLELGQMAYQLYKHKEVPELNEVVQNLIEVNRRLYMSTEQIEQIRKESKPSTCECGALIAKTDQFCGSCGKPQSQEEQPVLIECEQCSASVPKANYCACCGYLMKESYVGGVR